MARSGESPNRTWNNVATTRPSPSTPSAAISIMRNSARSRVDLGGVAGDGIGIGCGLRAGRPDLALDDAQALLLRAPRVGPSCQVSGRGRRPLGSAA